MYYKNQVHNLFYKLKYDFTVYDQFIYDALVATISPFTIYSHTIFPAPTKRSNQGMEIWFCPRTIMPWATLFSKQINLKLNFYNYIPSLLF